MISRGQFHAAFGSVNSLKSSVTTDHSNEGDLVHQRETLPVRANEGVLVLG